jgi:proteasome lid subunit RPN8/RPN11
VEGDIEFGDLQHVPPRTARRPDADLHYAVAQYGELVDGELPVFVDLDVMREIETHAASDTSVELGGVLLGGQYEDDDGRAFVVITDCLRAQHYESTKGSFKFTHETWEAITRQRDEFPEELQMVGWYHTHPDWGVFLSGMDMFICDHFFNKPLDVAYVVDPCRGDRGMFQWTRDPRQRTRRTGGFYVTASRFREDELEEFVEQLSQRGPSMPSLPHGSGAPVIHVSQPQPPAWQGVAVWGTLAAQFCLVALIAWRMLDPLNQIADAGGGNAAGKSRETENAAAMQTEFVDHVLRELRGTEEGFAERMEQEFARTRELETELQTERRQNMALLRDIDRAHGELKDKFEALESRLAVANERLAEAKEQNQELKGKLAAVDKARTAKKKADAAETEEAGVFPVAYVVGGGVGVLALVFLGLAFFWRRGEPLDERQDRFGRPQSLRDEDADADDESPESTADQPLRTTPRSET